MSFTCAEENETNKGFWQIERGIVQLKTINNLSDRIVLGWFYPKWILENIGNSKLPRKAVALSDVSLQWYSIKSINSSFSLSNKVLAQIIDRKIQTETLMAILGIKLVRTRLIQLFVMLRDQIGEKRILVLV